MILFISILLCFVCFSLAEIFLVNTAKIRLFSYSFTFLEINLRSYPNYVAEPEGKGSEFELNAEVEAFVD